MSLATELKITPFLVVPDALAAASFYTKAFGATVAESFTNDAKTFSLIRIGSAEFWIGDEEQEFGNHSPLKYGGSPVRMVLQTSDPDTFFSAALALGAAQICPVTVEEDWKIGKLQDPAGHIWEIGCQI